MWKLFTPVLGASLLLTLSASAGDVGLRPPRLPNPDPIRPFPPDNLNKTVIAEVKGTLRQVEVSGDVPEGFPIRDEKFRKGIWRNVFKITAAGKTYWLDLRSAPKLAALAEKLIGKSALVVGAVEQRTFWQPADVEAGVPPWLVPSKYRALVVRRLEVIETDSVRETVEVEAVGTLRYRGPQLELDPGFGAPSRRWVGYVVLVGRREYRLELSNPRLEEAAKLLSGQEVVVTGRLETREVEITRLDLSGTPRTYQVIVVTGLTPLGLCGTSPR